MADVKISQLPPATTPLTGSEQVPLVQSGVTKRTTVSDLSASQTLQAVTANGASTTINSAFNGANIGTFSGVPAVTSVGSTVGLANATNAAVLVTDTWRGTSNNNVNLGASGYNWNNVYGTTFNVGSGTATMTASGNNLVLNAVAAAVAGIGLAPATDNTYYLGGSSLKWKALYLGDGALTWNSYAIPAPTGGTTTFLRNDGTWAVPAGGGGGSGTVTSVEVSGGTTGLTTSGGPITTSGTITLGGTLAVANGGTGTATPALVAGTNVTITGTWPNQTINSSGGGSMTYPGAGIANSTGSAWGTSYSTTGTGTVLALATSPTLVTPVLGTPTSGDFSTGTFTWPTFNQNTTGTAANITASSNSTITTLSALSLPGSQVSGNISGNAANVTGTVAIANGGTGATTAANALTALGAYPSTNPSGYTSNTGTVTSVSALTLGTTGTDVSSSVATGTTTPVITLNLPSSSATNRGLLTAADWTTFNSKGSGTVTSVGWTGGIVSVATGTTTPAFTIAGTSGGVPYFNSASTWATSAALAANALVIGGGAGAAPATTTTGTGVVTALGVNVGSAGAFTTNNAANTFTALQTFSGSTSVLAMVMANAGEVATVSATAATGTINYDVTTQSVLYYTTSASANWTVNFRGSSGTSLNTLMAVGQSVTVAFLVTQGATAYYNNVVNIDGTAVTPKYQGGTAWAAGNASGIDSYVYTIIKTASATFTVLASQTQFK